MQHFFNVEIATKYGVNIAIFLNHLAFWVQHNMANEKHFHDGHYWTYNSKKAYATIFPYLTDKQIRTMIENAKSEGLILINNFNEQKYDQTSWYSLTEKSCKLLNLIICPPGQMDQPSRANGFAPQGQPIPDNINTDNINTDKKSFSAKADNQKKHSFAGSMDAMASEKRAIQEHERLKAVPIAEDMKDLVPIKSTRNESNSPRYTDWTQERLDREARGEVKPLISYW